MTIALPMLQPSPGADGPRPPAAPADLASDRLIDSHGRTIRDLRLSVTDRCNYRCVYCMDPDFRYMPKRELLDMAEYVSIVRVCRSLGVRKVRITGGEPTLYPELLPLIKALYALGLDEIAMTTNGSRMTKAAAKQWRGAGLTRLTLSLDSLQPERTRAITRTNSTPETTVHAIACAKAAGLMPIKVNAVVMRGINDDELADFADFAREQDIDLRLIEFMPLDSSRAWTKDDVVGASEMIEKIGARHELAPVGDDSPHSTSLNFTFADGAPGRIGIIAPVTRPFCGACNRLRVTADGKVRPCLFSTTEWDLRALLRRGATDAEVARFLVDATWTKQAGHGIGSESFVQPERTMSAIGG
jgi:cyclic pyranopterin phosphate synthase